MEISMWVAQCVLLRTFLKCSLDSATVLVLLLLYFFVLYDFSSHAVRADIHRE